ncbi:MAG TPA: LON peptidase substrate-binding domain-containing protein [Macromonas sp.]|nr:LON peptidase substrate-binding domain-containing protein [Macromonas sp.]
MNIPLFPLGTVLFPGGTLPLQIFEVRYLDMVRRCQREGTPFGVVCLTEGSEVQALDPSAPAPAYLPEQFETVGTLAHIEELEQPQPGLLSVVCRGSERFRVQHSEKLKHGLWMADTALLPPDMAAPVPPELQSIVQTLRQLYAQLQAQQPEAISPHPPFQDSSASPWQDAGWVANRWAELLPLPLSSKQQLLVLDSPLLRLELVGDALEQLGIVS